MTEETKSGSIRTFTVKIDNRWLLGTIVGVTYHPDCDMTICPCCGGQLTMCGCQNEGNIEGART